MVFFLTFYQSIVKKNVLRFPHKKAVKLFSALTVKINVSSANQHIRMISEGSCDTEECSDDAENSDLHQK